MTGSLVTFVTKRNGFVITQPLIILSRESPIQGHGSGDESSGKLYEAIVAPGATQRKG